MLRAGLALSVVVLALGSQPAAAQWSDPQKLSGDEDVNFPQLLFDSSGRALAAWADVHSGIVPDAVRIAARNRGADAFGRSRPANPAFAIRRDDAVGYGDGQFMQFDLDPGCTRCNPPGHALFLRFGSFNGSLGPRIRLRRTGRIDSRALSATRRGDAVLAWSEIGTKSRVHETYVVTRDRGRLSRPRIIAPRGAVEVATGANPLRGDYLVAWIRRGRVEARVRPAGGNWSRIHRLGNAASGRRLTAAVSRRGRLAVAWRAVDLIGEGEANPVRVAAAWGSLRSGFRDAVTLDSYTDLGGAGVAGGVFTAFSKSDAALVAWAGVDAQHKYRVHVAEVTSAVQSTAAVSPEGESHAIASFAAAPTSGAAAVAWISTQSHHVFASYLRGTQSTWGPPEQISREPITSPAYLDDVVIGFDSLSERATAVFRSPVSGSQNAIVASERR